MHAERAVGGACESRSVNGDRRVGEREDGLYSVCSGRQIVVVIVIVSVSVATLCVL